MAHDTDVTQGSGTGGRIALMEKVFRAVTKKFQRITTVAGDTMTITVVTATTTPINVAPASDTRVFVSVVPKSGTIYIGPTAADANNAAARKTVGADGAVGGWDQAYYAGDVFVRSDTSTVDVEVEIIT